MNTIIWNRWFCGVIIVICHISMACQEPPVESVEIKPDPSFIKLITQISEPGGYFDTDNLISNESSYLHVMDRLAALDLKGGAYIGVGPDQNFSYMAQIRPDIAFMIDIRRDNMLQHLFFKTLFVLADSRIEYLCLLFDKTIPSAKENWEPRLIEDILEYIDGADRASAHQDVVLSTVQQFGIGLSDQDLESIRKIHLAFIESGLDLQFNSFGRAPSSDYPTLRMLILQKTRSGKQANYLVREEDFQFLKSMQEGNRIIPVVGDLSGDHALIEIGSYLRAQSLNVSAFYTSNVEYYLMQQNTFEVFMQNVSVLPVTDSSLFIRSYFNRWAYHPQAAPGYASTQLLQPVNYLVNAHKSGDIQTYFDLISKGFLDNMVD